MEIWKPIPGFETEYHVSNLGRVKTVKQGAGIVTNRILKPGYNLCGYVQYTLGRYGGRHSAHLLVMRAFVGEKPEGYEINHINGIKSDNRVENLEYCTKSENKMHSILVLKQCIGEKHGNAKLSAKQVKEIRELGKTGMKHREIAAIYNVSRANISYILRGDAWKHIPD